MDVAGRAGHLAAGSVERMLGCKLSIHCSANHSLGVGGGNFAKDAVNEY